MHVEPSGQQVIAFVQQTAFSYGQQPNWLTENFAAHTVPTKQDPGPGGPGGGGGGDGGGPRGRPHQLYAEAFPPVEAVMLNDVGNGACLELLKN